MAILTHSRSICETRSRSGSLWLGSAENNIGVAESESLVLAGITGRKCSETRVNTSVFNNEPENKLGPRKSPPIAGTMASCPRPLHSSSNAATTQIIRDRVRLHKLASGSWCKSNTRKEWRITLAPSHACAHREVKREALTGETGRPAIEPRNQEIWDADAVLSSGKQYET